MRFARTGNNERIRILLDKKDAFLDDMEFSDGETALHVCDGNNSSISKKAN